MILGAYNINFGYTKLNNTKLGNAKLGKTIMCRKAWRQLTNMFGGFCLDRSGNIALITAFAGLPLLMACGFALDGHKVNREEIRILAALDAAALASVIPAHLNDQERTDHARSIFHDNYFGTDAVALTVNATAAKVSITASAQIPSILGELIGKKSFPLNVHSTAELTKANVICVLALDPVGANSLVFSDEAEFNSQSCSVQVNSTHDSAMVSDTINPPRAKSFCVSGISRGDFLPFVKHDCTPAIDPYVSLKLPEDGPCQNVKKLKGNLLTYQPFLEDDDMIGNFAQMQPGTYCKGIKISGIHVRFLPGTYIFKKGVTFKKYSSAKGVGVSMILKGKKSKVKIESGSQVDMTARSNGPYAGLVFFQKPEKVLGKKDELPTAISEIKSGGGLRLVGTAYFSTQKMLITSDSPVSSQSPATSFIAHNIEFGGKSKVNVYIDHEAGNIPPLLPRSDEGARLTR